MPNYKSDNRIYRSMNEESNITPPPDQGDYRPVDTYFKVDYASLVDSKPTGGKFNELHPFKSDLELVKAYREIHGVYIPDPYEHKSSHRLSMDADAIRCTWGLEASYPNTIGREVTSDELITRLDRSIGIIFGLACGDALGRPVEFLSPEQIESKYGVIRDFEGDGSHDQPAGTVTDDTNLALYLIANILKNNSFDPDHYAGLLIEWFRNGPFDIGLTTMSSIDWLKNGYGTEEAGYKTLEQRGASNAAGNGCVMRCAPLAIAYPDNREQLIEVSIASSEITHADERCKYGTAILNLTLASIIQGSETPLKDALKDVSPDAPTELVTRLEQIPQDIEKEDLKNTGYVVDTLETALYIGLTSKDPEEAVITAVNMGGDADTIGAIAGAIVGARFGAGWRFRAHPHKPDATFPSRWTNNLRMESKTYEDYIIPTLLELGQNANEGIATPKGHAESALKLARQSCK